MARGHYHYDMFTCPFYTSDERLKVTCENRSTVRFYTKAEAKKHIRAFCASKKGGWTRCTIAQMLNMHYEGGEDENANG